MVRSGAKRMDRPVEHGLTLPHIDREDPGPHLLDRIGEVRKIPPRIEPAEEPRGQEGMDHPNPGRDHDRDPEVLRPPLVLADARTVAQPAPDKGEREEQDGQPEPRAHGQLRSVGAEQPRPQCRRDDRRHQLAARRPRIHRLAPRPYDADQPHGRGAARKPEGRRPETRQHALPKTDQGGEDHALRHDHRGMYSPETVHCGIKVTEFPRDKRVLPGSRGPYFPVATQA